MINLKFKPLMTAALLLLGCSSLTAFAGDLPANDPCGDLFKMGNIARIYNQSDFDWIVSFKTEAFKFTNAGAVKYLDNDVWKDSGTGDYRSYKTYDIPVPKHENVKIAYCGTRNYLSQEEIQGKISFKATDRFYTNGIPEGNVSFVSVKTRNTPKFSNSGNTSFVNYNRIDTGELLDGNITICPNDAQCVAP